MTGAAVGRRRSGWDVLLGVLLVIAGVAVLGHTVLATAVSVLFLAWSALIGGVVLLVGAVFQIGRGGFWATALAGGLLLVLGLVLVRNPDLAALSLTLVAGSLFLAGGVVRLVLAFAPGAPTVVLLLAGLVGIALGLIVLFNIVEATLTLLGVLLGVQALTDGLMLLLFGRLEVRRSARATGTVVRQ